VSRRGRRGRPSEPRRPSRRRRRRSRRRREDDAHVGARRGGGPDAAQEASQGLVRRLEGLGQQHDGPRPRTRPQHRRGVPLVREAPRLHDPLDLQAECAANPRIDLARAGRIPPEDEVAVIGHRCPSPPRRPRRHAQDRCQPANRLLRVGIVEGQPRQAPAELHRGRAEHDQPGEEPVQHQGGEQEGPPASGQVGPHRPRSARGHVGVRQARVLRGPDEVEGWNGVREQAGPGRGEDRRDPVEAVGGQPGESGAPGEGDVGEEEEAQRPRERSDVEGHAETLGQLQEDPGLEVRVEASPRPESIGERAPGGQRLAPSGDPAGDAPDRRGHQGERGARLRRATRRSHQHRDQQQREEEQLDPHEDEQEVPDVDGMTAVEAEDRCHATPAEQQARRQCAPADDPDRLLHPPSGKEAGAAGPEALEPGPHRLADGGGNRADAREELPVPGRQVGRRERAVPGQLRFEVEDVAESHQAGSDRAEPIARAGPARPGPASDRGGGLPSPCRCA
jgi:hypothetical protein